MTDTTKEQLDRFKEVAREIGTDDDEAKFNEKLKKLVRSSEKHPLGKVNSDSDDKSGD